MNRVLVVAATFEQFLHTASCMQIKLGGSISAFSGKYYSTEHDCMYVYVSSVVQMRGYDHTVRIEFWGGAENRPDYQELLAYAKMRSRP